MQEFNKNIENALPGLKKHASILGKKHSINPEDLLQSSVVRAIEKQHLFDGKYFNAWIKRIMTNIAIDAFREEIKNNPRVEVQDAKNLKKVLTPKSRWSVLKKVFNLSIKNGETELVIESESKEKEDSENTKKEEEIIQLINSIRKLGKNCQEILRAYLQDKDGSSQKQIATSLSIPMGTVASRFQRCIINLSKIIKKLPEFNKD